MRGRLLGAISRRLESGLSEETQRRVRGNERAVVVLFSRIRLTSERKSLRESTQKHIKKSLTFGNFGHFLKKKILVTFASQKTAFFTYLDQST